jgi:hypothetical protein
VDTDDSEVDADADIDDELSLGDLLMGEPEDGEEEPEDYVEEKTTADGQHIRKEVHQGNGFKSVRITSDGGSGDAIPDLPQMFGGGGGGIPSLMQAMMQGMASGPAIRISSGPMGGPGGGGMMVRRVAMPMPLFDDDDDDDDGGIPPEILQLIKMTEMMHSRSSMGGP